MDTKLSFVISVIHKKENKDSDWVYLGIVERDNGKRAVCWITDEDKAAVFHSIKTAREFFSKYKETLLASGNFDMKTLGIRKRIYKLVENL